MPAALLTSSASELHTTKGKTMKQIDMRLERDPRYLAAKNRLAELQGEARAIEVKRDNITADISAQGAAVASTQIQKEATAMLAGGVSVAQQRREAMHQELGDVAHQLAVVRAAINMQRDIVTRLADEVSREIATDVLPLHHANVRAVAAALLDLNTALEAEAELRDVLRENGVMYSGVIRPMPVTGVGTLRDDQGKTMRYLLECFEYGFLADHELPDVVRSKIVVKIKKIAPEKPAAPRNNDGWQLAS